MEDFIPLQNREQALLVIANNGLRRKFLEWLESDKVNITTLESKTEADAIAKMESQDFKLDYVFIETARFDILNILAKTQKKDYFVIALIDPKTTDQAKKDEFQNTGRVEEITEIPSLNIKLIESLIINKRLKKSGRTKTKERYQFIKILGLGTTGQVDLMKDNEKDILLAVKKIPLALMDEEAKEKTANEIKYLRRVKGPTIIEFFDSVTLNNMRYIYLEYAEQGTLEEKILEKLKKGGDFDVNTILEWICEVFIALFTLHNSQMIHRDMKCENILITKDNIAKLSDLGISRLLVGNQLAATFCGTPYYICPEILNEEQYSFNSDIWSVGVVLYELITLKKPFFKDKITDLYGLIKSGEYPMLNENIDERLKYLVSVMLRVSQLRRFNIEDIIKLDFISEKIKEICEKYKWVDQVPQDIFVQEDKLIACYVNYRPLQSEEDYIDIRSALQIQENCVYSSFKSGGFFSKKIPNAVEADNLFITFNEMNLESTLNVKDSTFFNRLIKKEILIPLSHPGSEIVDQKGRYYIFSFEHRDELIDNTNITNSLNLKRLNLIELSKFCLNQAMKLYKMLIELIQKQGVMDLEIKSEIIGNTSYVNLITGISLLKRFNINDLVKDDRCIVILNIYQTMLIHNILNLVFHKYTKNSSLLGFFKTKPQVTYAFKDFSLSNMEIKHVLIRGNMKPPNHYLRLVSSSDPKNQILNGMNDLKLLLVAPDFPSDLNQINFEEPSYMLVIFDEKDLNTQLNDFTRHFAQEILFYEENVLQVPKYLENYIKDFGSSDNDFFLFMNKHSNLLQEGEKESDVKITIKYY